jgi:uncharacterized protein YndB with AHSA1/START domain
VSEKRLRWVRIDRHLIASPERVYRAWSDPDELMRWFPIRVDGSLAVNTRSDLIWPKERTWIDVQTAEPNRLFVFRWPWLPDDSCLTTVTVTIRPVGTGTLIRLEDGPFDIDQPGVLDAFEEALVGWAEAIAQLRAQLDYSVDLRASD